MSTEDRSADYVNELPSSIEINRGMKGDVGWSVKIRGADGDEFTLVDRVAAIDAALSIRFRKPNPTLEEQLGASIEQAKDNKPIARKTIEEAEEAYSRAVPGPNPDAMAAPLRRVPIAEGLDNRVNERLANERAGRPNL